MNDPKLPAPAGEALAGDAKNQGPHSLPGQRLWSPRARGGKFVSDRGRNWLSWLTDGHLLLCTHTINLSASLGLREDGTAPDGLGSPFPSQSPQPAWGRPPHLPRHLLLKVKGSTATRMAGEAPRVTTGNRWV